MIEKGGVLLEIGDEIHVAVWRLLLACAGAEHKYPFGVVASGYPQYLVFQLMKSVKLAHGRLPLISHAKDNVMTIAPIAMGLE
jgi:hypothetical protein